MAPICANKSDRKSYMNEIDGFSVLLTFPKPKANRSRKRRQFHGFFTFAGGCLIKTDPFLQDCSTSRICSMCFAREENAITRKWQNQTHWPSIRRNIQAPPPRRVTVLQRSDKNRLKKPYRNASKSTRPPKRRATTKVTKAVGKNTRPSQLSRQTCAKHGKPKGTFKPKDKKIFHFAAIEFWRHLSCRQRQAGWWFQTFFIFNPTWGGFPFWLTFLTWWRGLKPPTSRASNQFQKFSSQKSPVKFFHSKNPRLDGWTNGFGWMNQWTRMTFWGVRGVLKITPFLRSQDSYP